MADQLGYVAYWCEWCGQNFHDVTDEHSMPGMAIYRNRYGKRFCCPYCMSMWASAENDSPPKKSLGFLANKPRII